MHPSLYNRCLTESWYHNPALLPMYTRIQDHQDYPSPAPSDPSPTQQQQQQQQQQDHNVNQDLSTSFDQIDSSIGPTRVSRRQASLKQGLLVRRVSLSTNYRPEVATSSLTQDATGTRPDSPLNDKQPDLLVASPHVPSLQSPYHPNTPSSMTSPYSPFEHVRRSRTRSTSHFEGRPQSPALSTTSGVTNSSHALDSSISAESSKIAPRPIIKEKHKKHRLRDVDRKNICRYHLSNPNARQEDIGAVFGVERSTISKILKEKDRWLNISEEDECDQTTKHRPSKFPEIEEEMLTSLQEWSDGGVSITDQLIRQRALSIAKSFHITPDRFKGSSGWVENFKHRHDIRRGEWLRAIKILPPDYTIHETHSSAVPPTPVLMAYDQRMHLQGSESQSPNGTSRPSESHEDQQHVHGRLSTTSSRWPEAVHSDVPQSPSASAVIDPVLQAPGSLSPPDPDHTLSHPLQDIQHSPEIQHHQPQQLHHHQHQQHYNHDHQQHQQQHQQHQQHHDHNQQYHTVVYNAYGQPLCGPGVSAPNLNPTIGEAEEAINLLLTFLNGSGRGIIKLEDRQKLAEIKCTLFQAASGIPFGEPVD